MRRTFSSFSLVAIIGAVASILLLVACGGGSNSPVVSQPVSIAVNPSISSGVTGTAITFTASVSNASNTTVTWSILEGPTAGAITNTGVFTPAAPGTFHVIATSAADSSKSATATVTITSTIIVSVSPSTANAGDQNLIAQAGEKAAFSATVLNTSNIAVTWLVNGVSGGTPGTGTITTTGVYTAPTQVDDTTDFMVTATSQADHTKSASTRIRVYAAPRIGARVGTLNGEFYDRQTGQKFIPRGNNYLRLEKEIILPFNESHDWFTLLSVGHYDTAKIETTLSSMQALAYNLVRVWTDCCGTPGGLGNPNGEGLNAQYLSNVADFIRRARAHHLYVTITVDDLPKAGGYQQTIGADCFASWPNCNNLTFTTTAGVSAERKFWQDLVRGLVAANAPMDGIFSYQLREEYWYPADFQKSSFAPLPLLPTSGTFVAANGTTYDMGDTAQRKQMMDESLTYWANQARASIQQVAPGALVGVGFVTGGNPYVPTFSAAAASTMDYIDGHTGPGEGTTITDDFGKWGKPQTYTAKPVIQGEFAARVQPFPVETDAAAALKQWQIDGCNIGISGWALWSWDFAEQDTLGFEHWYATRETGLVGRILSPSLRPDPCT